MLGSCHCRELKIETELSLVVGESVLFLRRGGANSARYIGAIL